MPRKPTPDPEAQSDSAFLHRAIQDVIDGMGRGGLSYMAERLGVTPSMLRKRLAVPGKAFDAPTLRAAAVLIELSSAPPEPPEPA